MRKHSLLLLSILLLSSCSVKNSEEGIQVTDTLERSHIISKDKRSRVVCIGAGALRLYSYIGDRNLLCGVEDIDSGNEDANPFKGISRPYYDLNKDFYEALPSCGKGGPKNQQAEAERILSCNPDIVISEYQDKKASDDLEQKLGVPVINVSYGKNSVFDDNIKKSLNILGKVFSKEERAKELTSYIDTCKKELSEKKSEEEKTCYIGCLGNYGVQDIYSTSSDYPLFNVSGVKNVLSGSIELTNGRIDSEKFFSLDMDYIFLDAAGTETFKGVYTKKKNLFDSIDAVKKGEVYLEMPFNAYYTNLEVALMDAYFIASSYHKDAYQGFDIKEKSEEISKMFLQEECYDKFISKAKYSYGGFQKISSLSDFFGGKASE